MSVKSLIVICGLLACAACPAAAQTTAAPVHERIAPSRVRAPIEIHPGRLLYRRCVGWYELQDRPSGTVLYPGKHCWWVRG